MTQKRAFGGLEACLRRPKSVPSATKKRAFGDQKPFLKKRFLDFQKTLGAGWKLVMINAF